MGEEHLERTRRSLHGLAELVLAGPQYDAVGSIRLRVTPGGFGTVAAPDLRVDGLELVSATGRVPIRGTFAGLARACGVRERSLSDLYADGPRVAPEEEVGVNPDCVTEIVTALALGDAALRVVAADLEPVLWPEHFDVAVSVDEVNYGVSAGDASLLHPYAYVGPWHPRSGSFWNQAFGATRPIRELRTLEALVAFFRDGAIRALTDPPIEAPR